MGMERRSWCIRRIYKGRAGLLGPESVNLGLEQGLCSITTIGRSGVYLAMCTESMRIMILVEAPQSLIFLNPGDLKCVGFPSDHEMRYWLTT